MTNEATNEATNNASPLSKDVGQGVPLKLRGLATVSFFAADVRAASQWYTALLGSEPYFVRPIDGPPAYVEFRIGDHQDELGIIDSRYAPHTPAAGPAGAIIYWHVDDLPATLNRLLTMGATVHEPLTERGEGFATASVLDPFGNILGIMYNSHFLQVARSAADPR